MIQRAFTVNDIPENHIKFNFRENVVYFLIAWSFCEFALRTLVVLSYSEENFSTIW